MYTKLSNSVSLTGSFVTLILLVFLSGCSTTSGKQSYITIEGQISVRGNEPFTTYVLETPEQNSYVLLFSESSFRRQLLEDRVRVTGQVDVREWGGIPFTHLQVIEAMPVP